MPPEDQLQDFIGPMLVAFGSGALIVIGIVSIILWIREPGKAGLRRRKIRHRKGVRYHKPTYSSVKPKARSNSKVIFSHTKVYQPRGTTLPVTAIMQKIGADNEDVPK